MSNLQVESTFFLGVLTTVILQALTIFVVSQCGRSLYLTIDSIRNNR